MNKSNYSVIIMLLFTILANQTDSKIYKFGAFVSLIMGIVYLILGQ
jgi:hypothetical protein